MSFGGRNQKFTLQAIYDKMINVIFWSCGMNQHFANTIFLCIKRVVCFCFRTTSSFLFFLLVLCFRHVHKPMSSPLHNEWLSGSIIYIRLFNIITVGQILLRIDEC